MNDLLAAVAGRLDRAGDRMRNAGFYDLERKYRSAAFRVRAGADLTEALQIEQDAHLSTNNGQFSRVVALAAPGEYDDPTSPGTHTQIVDGMRIEVPDGSHAELRPGGITIVPDRPTTPPGDPDLQGGRPGDANGPFPGSGNGNQAGQEKGVDFNFIGTLEGGQETEGSIPDSAQSNSGVTVATGVDIGQMNTEDIQNLDIPESLKEKLTPYAELTGADAENYLAEHPLNLTPAEANALDRAVQQDAIERITNSYDGATTGTPFAQLPPEAQTVITSVSFQYGNLATRTPNFWRDVTTQNWQAAIRDLRNFGDRYPTRHGHEADLLQQMLDRQNQAHSP